VAGLGLEAAGVEFDKKGSRSMPAWPPTSRVYAVGDVTGKYLLAHVAMARG